ncbi:MAG: hypothetical protein K0S08_575 [Gammaproteobacteria bacterium]|jgi:hypothetical protein|nr:hypothetical protein [Gammaproteobacteria bacterium]
MRIKKEGINDSYHISLAKAQDKFGCTIAYQNNYGKKELIFANVADFEKICTALTAMLPKSQRNISLRMILDPADYRCVVIEKPAVADRYLQEAIHWKLTKELHQSLENYSLQTYQPVMEQQMLWVYLVSNDILNQYKQLALSFPNFKLELIAPPEFALLNLLNALTNSEKGRFGLIHEFSNFFMLIFAQSGRLEKVSLIPSASEAVKSVWLSQIRNSIESVESTQTKVNKYFLSISKNSQELLAPALQEEKCEPLVLQNVEVIKAAEWVELVVSVGGAL